MGDCLPLLNSPKVVCSFGNDEVVILRYPAARKLVWRKENQACNAYYLEELVHCLLLRKKRGTRQLWPLDLQMPLEISG